MRSPRVTLQVEMDLSPPTFMTSFTDAHETRICGQDTCGQMYRNCTPEEKALWKRLTNSCNILGETVRWVCRTCAEYYCSKSTTQRQGAINLKVLTS